MADESSTPAPQERQFGGRPGGRPGAGREPGGREPGGFRIRLSDNEMRAARAVQEAFRLRSTVAALGFALRATAQMLEEGKLDELVAQQRNQAPSRGDGPRGDGPRGEGSRGGGCRDGNFEGRQERAPRIDPFARPSRPAPAVAEPAADVAEPVADVVEPATADPEIISAEEAAADDAVAQAAAE